MRFVREALEVWATWNPYEGQKLSREGNSVEVKGSVPSHLVRGAASNLFGASHKGPSKNNRHRCPYACVFE